jgi:hypothetical protein
MTDLELLESLKDVALQLDIETRWEEGEFAGGLCRLGEKQLFLINRSLPPASQVELLCRGLSGFDLSRVFMLPAVRKQISRCCGTLSPTRQPT